jgi:hypothetical protein
MMRGILPGPLTAAEIDDEFPFNLAMADFVRIDRNFRKIGMAPTQR